MAKFIIYPDAKGEYRWRLKAVNGRIVADSAEGYYSKQCARQDVEWVRTYANGAEVEEL